MEPGGEIVPEEKRYALMRGFVWSIGSASVLTGLVYLIGHTLNPYGFWLFGIAPVVAGLLAGTANNWRQQSPAKYGWNVALFSYVVASFALLAVVKEGFICLFMAAPIVIPLHALSYVAAARFVDFMRRGRQAMVSVAVLLLIPAVQSARFDPEPVVRIETTTVDIAAPPERVWPLLFDLPNLPAPQDLLLRAGVAHPVRVVADGQTVGDRRVCDLSTGPMNERISVSEPGRRLRFDVLQTPPPVRELNPFGNVDSPHQHSYVNVIYGEFRLTPLRGGGTRLTGESKYDFRLYPAAFWSLWTDHIVDQVHRSVMDEVKKRAEAVGRR